MVQPDSSDLFFLLRLQLIEVLHIYEVAAKSKSERKYGLWWLFCGFYFETFNLFRLQCLFLLMILCNRCSTYVRTWIRFARNYSLEIVVSKTSLNTHTRVHVHTHKKTHLISDDFYVTFNTWHYKIYKMNEHSNFVIKFHKWRKKRKNKQINLVRLFLFSKLFL